MFNLSEITDVEAGRLVENASPALRSALERQLTPARDGHREGSFKSFISGSK
ncbi:hypothetical protein LTT66_32015 [Nocardia gipuzkoensis]|uniref:hypothetical protein n=1 Tax=Nocardia gipuzkoensis TaxID=2749991 RepID=UPI001E2C27F6|nr:hypothetical protein [Nocardia gipuzkoensis]UGT67769.1 hypothetical protein LTT66_32015 [Nocardia gipuzkoensis]